MCAIVVNLTPIDAAAVQDYNIPISNHKSLRKNSQTLVCATFQTTAAEVQHSAPLHTRSQQLGKI